MQQTSLFDLPPAPRRYGYQAGSDTSQLAAERAPSFADGQRAKLLAWLKARPEGGTQIEAAAGIEIARHSLTWRFRELVTDGLIVKLPTIRQGAHVYSAR